MKNGKGIPFNDLRLHHDEHRAEFHRLLDELLDSSAFVGGPAIRRFEENFASFCGVGHCAGTANGTDAIFAALRALGVGPGDLVVTVPNSFIATTEAITIAGAGIVFCDVGEDDLLMDLGKLAQILDTHPERSRIRCVIPVHLFGQPVDLAALRVLIGKRDIRIMADTAQAHGAELDGRPVAALADMSTYSFYPGKNLGALGDGGALASNDAALVEKARTFCNHGRSSKYFHHVEGVNSRLDTLQAMFLDRKLGRLAENTRLRRAHARHYQDLLGGVSGIRLLPWNERRLSVMHLYVVRVADRDGIARELKEQGIETGVHYPVPLHLLPAYERLGLRAGSYPVAERAAGEILSLPLYPEMEPAAVETVAARLRECVARRRA